MSECDVTWEAIAGFASVIVAAFAFFLTIWQACIARQHNKLSVKPYLSAWTHQEPTQNSYSIELSNCGVGPALIDQYLIQVDGQTMQGQGIAPTESAMKVLFPQYKYNLSASYFLPGYMMAAKESRTLLKIQFSGPTIPSLEEVLHARNRLRMICRYRSVYGVKDTFDSDTFKQP